MTGKVGIRVEFYGDILHPAATFTGAASSGEKQYAVEFLPREGEWVAADQLIRVPGAAYNVLASGGLFLRVHHVEHWPALAEEERDAPTVIVVLHAAAPGTDQEAAALVAGFETEGWVMHARTPHDGEGSPLARAVNHYDG
jgi:hypothetical protein